MRISNPQKVKVRTLHIYLDETTYNTLMERYESNIPKVTKSEFISRILVNYLMQKKGVDPHA